MIAKADTMTPEEVTHFKRQIMNQILQAKIRIYEFPDEETLGNGVSTKNEVGSDNRKIKDRVPFAIVGSNCLIEGPDGKKVRGRKYPWGIVDVSSKRDFISLKCTLAQWSKRGNPSKKNAFSRGKEKLEQLPCERFLQDFEFSRAFLPPVSHRVKRSKF